MYLHRKELQKGCHNGRKGAEEAQDKVCCSKAAFPTLDSLFYIQYCKILFEQKM